MRFKMEKSIVENKFKKLENKNEYGWTVKVKKAGVEYLCDEDANVIVEGLQIWNFMESGYAAVYTLDGKSKYVTRNYVLRETENPLKTDKLFEEKEWKNIMHLFDKVIRDMESSALYDNSIKKSSELLKALEYECRFRAEKYPKGSIARKYYLNTANRTNEMWDPPMIAEKVL